ncbi:unnamed protein product, partial [Adineta steineri]
PNTFWWNKTKNDPEINVTLVKSRLVETIFNKSIDHHAHRGDIMRLEVLIEYGGIYLDTDVLVLRSFAPLLNISDVIMAHQSDDPKTACNAVILAKKNATFLRRLYHSYQSFDSRCWDCHSVKLTGQLASIYIDEVVVLPTDTFFRPGWDEPDKFFKSNDYNFTSNYAAHLWNTVNNHYLSVLTPDIALRTKPNSRITVLRNGKIQEIPIIDVVVGDVCPLKSDKCDHIPADGLVIESNSLEVDESEMTGEIESINRCYGDIVFGDTVVKNGTRKMVVIRVGEYSSVGAGDRVS